MINLSRRYNTEYALLCSTLLFAFRFSLFVTRFSLFAFRGAAKDFRAESIIPTTYYIHGTNVAYGDKHTYSYETLRIVYAARRNQPTPKGMYINSDTSTQNILYVYTSTLPPECSIHLYAHINLQISKSLIQYSILYCTYPHLHTECPMYIYSAWRSAQTIGISRSFLLYRGSSDYISMSSINRLILAFSESGSLLVWGKERKREGKKRGKGCVGVATLSCSLKRTNMNYELRTTRTTRTTWKNYYYIKYVFYYD